MQGKFLIVLSYFIHWCWRESIALLKKKIRGKGGNFPRKEAVIMRNDAAVPKNEAVIMRNDAAVPKNEVVVMRNDVAVPKNEAIVIRLDRFDIRSF